MSSPADKHNGLTYADSGVDISAGDVAVERIKALAKSTFGPETLSDIGLFGGMFQPNLSGMSQPVLVSSTDGVGTKLKLAFMTGVYDTIGADLVNHCVNDILAQGARPLFFLDYIATGRLSPDTIVQIVGGMAGACRKTGTALIGGETAEMPDFYAPGEFDIAGCIVGLVDRTHIVDGRSVKVGDVVIGVASNGLHTNGYTLARKAIFEVAGKSHTDQPATLGDTIGATLLETHICYLSFVQDIFNSLGRDTAHGMAHITGGGIAGNLARIIPATLCARLARGVWPIPPIFPFIQACGNISESEMYRAFNMGVGYIIVADASCEKALIALAEKHGHHAFPMGQITTRGSSSPVVFES